MASQATRARVAVRARRRSCISFRFYPADRCGVASFSVAHLSYHAAHLAGMTPLALSGWFGPARRAVPTGGNSLRRLVAEFGGGAGGRRTRAVDRARGRRRRPRVQWRLQRHYEDHREYGAHPPGHRRHRLRTDHAQDPVRGHGAEDWITAQFRSRAAVRTLWPAAPSTTPSTWTKPPTRVSSPASTFAPGTPRSSAPQRARRPRRRIRRCLTADRPPRRPLIGPRRSPRRHRNRRLVDARSNRHLRPRCRSTK